MIDSRCIEILLGCSIKRIVKVIKNYYSYEHEDPLVFELKQKMA